MENDLESLNSREHTFLKEEIDICAEMPLPAYSQLSYFKEIDDEM
jgi:hypothetical protein